MARLSLLMLCLVCAAPGVIPGFSSVRADDYVDPAGKYKMTLVGDWKPVVYSDAVGRQKTEFIFRDRSEGLLKISKESLSGTLAETVRREEENLRIYRSGYERSSVEAFGGGNMPGMRLSFFTTESNRKTAHTYYYLEDKGSVWVLRFSGKQGTLDTIRNITDQIARSFKSI